MCGSVVGEGSVSTNIHVNMFTRSRAPLHPTFVQCTWPQDNRPEKQIFFLSTHSQHFLQEESEIIAMDM